MSDIARRLLDWLFPRFCGGCGRLAEEGHLCWDCRAALPYLRPPYCECCGDPVGGRVGPSFVCALCAERSVTFARARSVVRYDGPARRAIRELKYRGALWLASDLAELLESGVRAHYPDLLDFDVVTWVPLHPLRYWRRGFNQSAELARELARRLGRPAVALARRVRPTPSQTALTIPQRAANVRHAFRAAVNARWRGARALLVDDVMTTGATVHACAGALLDGGLASVDVITVARG